MQRTELNETVLGRRVRQLEDLYARLTAAERALAEVEAQQGFARWSSVPATVDFVRQYTTTLQRLRSNTAALARSVRVAAINLERSAAALLEQDRAAADRLRGLLTTMAADQPAAPAVPPPSAPGARPVAGFGSS